MDTGRNGKVVGGSLGKDSPNLMIRTVELSHLPCPDHPGKQSDVFPSHSDVRSSSIFIDDNYRQGESVLQPHSSPPSQSLKNRQTMQSSLPKTCPTSLFPRPRTDRCVSARSALFTLHVRGVYGMQIDIEFDGIAIFGIVGHGKGDWVMRKG